MHHVVDLLRFRFAGCDSRTADFVLGGGEQVAGGLEQLGTGGRHRWVVGLIAGFHCKWKWRQMIIFTEVKQYNVGWFALTAVREVVADLGHRLGLAHRPTGVYLRIVRIADGGERRSTDAGVQQTTDATVTQTQNVAGCGAECDGAGTRQRVSRLVEVVDENCNRID